MKDKDRELDTIIDNSFGMFLKEKENPIYLNIKDQAISQIKALVIKSLGEKMTGHRYDNGSNSAGYCNGRNQHIAEMKEKWK